MPKKNFDDVSLFEPIEFTLEGKDYVIKKVTSKMMQDATKSSKDNPDSLDVLAEQVAVFTGAPKEEFQSVDIRKLGAVIQFIVGTFNEQVKNEKNVPGAGVKS